MSRTTKGTQAVPLTAAPVRSPVKAACLALVTASLYGFWWWYDLNRQLRALGKPARPWRSLGEVVLGLAVIAPAVMAGWPWAAVALAPVSLGLCLLAVWQTATLLAEAQRERHVRSSIDARLAVGIAGIAGAGAIAWYALAVLQVPGFLMVGVLWPLVAMCFVGYMQAQLNTLLGRSQ